MKRIILSSLLIMITLLSCNTTEPIPVNENIKITEIDAAVIEAYLNIQIENPSLNKEVVIERNGEKVISFTASKTDTAITDTGLTESTLYKYKAKLTEKGKVIGESSEVSVTTMLPTSHNFVWEKYTFGGGGGSSVLKDVAIIDENNIWAVGEIYVKDSLGNDELIPYNAVHWNGTKWELKRIRYYGNCSAVEYPPLKAIWAFSADNILITNGGSIGWFDGSNVYLDCGVNPLLTGAINKIWGSSDKDVYVVGNKGNIAHYNNRWWEKIESGTNIDIQDVWGEVDNTTGKTTILVAASNIFFNEGMKLLQIKDNVITLLKTDGLSWSLSGVWFELGKQYYLVGDGIFQKKNLEEEKWKNKPLDFTQYYTYRIKGNYYNDIIVVGSQGESLHYNGKNWKSFIEQTSLSYGNYYSVAIKGNIAVTVGQDGDNAVIAIGRRN